MPGNAEYACAEAKITRLPVKYACRKHRISASISANSLLTVSRAMKLGQAGTENSIHIVPPTWLDPGSLRWKVSNLYTKPFLEKFWTYLLFWFERSWSEHHGSVCAAEEQGSWWDAWLTDTGWLALLLGSIVTEQFELLVLSFGHLTNSVLMIKNNWVRIKEL